MKYRKRTYRKNLKNQSKIILIGLFGLLLFISFGYGAFSTNINLSAKGNIKDKSRVIQSWDLYSNEDFHSDFYKKNIISATFTDTAVVPSNAVEKWDVSADKKGGVVAYITESSESGKYELYIGANGGVIANENSSELFRNFININYIYFNDNFDTSNTIYMNGMFDSCFALNEVDIENFDTSNVVNMEGMFYLCRSLKYLNLSNFDTSNVTNMSYMFCMWNKEDGDSSTGNLIELNLNNFNTSKVTMMNDMFSFNKNLRKLKIDNFDTSNVTSMWHMFLYLENLTSLNLCSFNTSKVSTMNSMFRSTTSVKNIYVGNGWNTNNADIAEMFTYSNVSDVTYNQCH